MNILIAVPTFETIFPDTYKSIWDLDKANHKCDFEFVRGYDCAMARNNISTLAQERGVDYVLMVDNDTVLPNDALVNLLDDPKDVCLGYYARRAPSGRYEGESSVSKIAELNKQNLYTEAELKELRDKGEYKVQIFGGGMGCALIKTDVFERLEYPYFDWVNYRNKMILSEDLYFGKQCMNYDVPVYVDTRVECGHIFRYIQYMRKD